MKKILICLLLCMVGLGASADEQRKVTLSADHNKEAINLSYCNIFINLRQADDESGEVSIELENLSESKALILFDRSYMEKQVKKLTPKMQFDKKFGGTKGKRVIEACSEQLTSVMQFRPSDKYPLPAFRVENEATKVVTLPVYIAKYKGKNLILMEKQIIQLDIEAELKPSAEYVRMNTQCEQLIREIERTGVCPNKSHRTSVDKQKEEYQKKIDDLKSKIDAIISSHGWNDGDNGARRYRELKSKLDNVEIAERDCGRHKAIGGGGGHKCTYCGWSLQQIYHKLDDLYKKVYSSGDRKAAKAGVMAQVNALYNCCTDARCSKHSAQWKKGGDYKNKIVERYNRINSL